MVPAHHRKQPEPPPRKQQSEPEAPHAQPQHHLQTPQLAPSRRGGSLVDERLLLRDPATAGLCTCLTRPLTCELGTAGCIEGQPSWRRTVAATGCVGANASLLAHLLLLSRARLRIFMYGAPPHAAEPKSSWQRGYMVESAFHARLSSSRLRTTAPRSANLFYVPVHPIGCHSQKRNPNEGGHRSNLRTVRSCAEEVARVTRHVASAGPYLARHGGADHFWVSAHDAGKDYASMAPALLRASCLTNTADVAASKQSEAISGRHRPPFVPSRDIAAVPCIKSLPDAAGVLPPARRPTLAFFAGTVDAAAPATSTDPRRVRNVRIEAFGAFERQERQGGGVGGGHAGGGGAGGGGAGGGRSRRVQISLSRLSPKEYSKAQQSAVFCLCPQGHAVWSPRLIESILYGCLPVVLADAYWLPFACFFDWRAFAVVVPEADAGRVPALLAGMAPARVDAMHAELMRVRHFFAWGHGRAALDEAHVDAFDVLMLEAYAKAQLCRRWEAGEGAGGAGGAAWNASAHRRTKVEDLS